MFKKFASLLALVAVLATITITNVSAAPLAPTFRVSVFANPSSFNPANENTTISVTSTGDIDDLYAYVLYPSNQLYIFPSTNHVTMTAGTKSFVWTGRSLNEANGAALPSGNYIVKVYAKNASGTGVAQTVITLNSSVIDNPTAPSITNLRANPASFLGNGSGSTTLSFGVSDDANLTVAIKKGATTVRTFAGYTSDLHADGTYSIVWDGKDTYGSYVAADTYVAEVTAKNADGSDTETTTVTVGQASVSSDIVTNFELDPSGTWDPSDDTLQIEFDLEEEVDDLTIEAVKGNTTVEILSDENLDNDNYEEEWDGTDEDGDYVAGGLWNIVITADGDTVSLPITIAYEQPGITSAFVTKESFDPTKDEYTTLVYKVDTASDVTVEVYQGTHRELTLVDEESVNKNKWYAVKFDGTDEDGDEVDEGDDWSFKITATNSTDDDVETVESVEFSVEEDDVSNGKSNVTNDAMEPVIFDDEDSSDGLELAYCIDEDADVFAAIYKGTSAGSNSKIDLLDYVAQDAGCHTISWNGKDEDNKKLDDGIYTYKLISKTDNSKKDNEVGKFVVGKTTGKTTPNPTPDDDGDYSCSMYSDMYNADGTELCDAIGWATARGIFHGYPNNTFQPYKDISRAEVLKVVLEGFEAALLPANGTNLGFKDLNPAGWYMTYLRTAQFHNMLEGYEDGTARPENNITRVQALKFVLEASQSFTGQLVKGGTASYVDVDYTKWYAQYVGAAYTYQLFDANYTGSQVYLHPDQLAKRGEIALMLYRLNKEGFIK
ncbi:MAG: FlgD immunoglobulin-like domain containing protein [Candidatus Gracilibacteria bacterium]